MSLSSLAAAAAMQTGTSSVLAATAAVVTATEAVAAVAAAVAALKRRRTRYLPRTRSTPGLRRCRLP